MVKKSNKDNYESYEQYQKRMIKESNTPENILIAEFMSENPEFYIEMQKTVTLFTQNMWEFFTDCQVGDNMVLDFFGKKIKFTITEAKTPKSWKI